MNIHYLLWENELKKIINECLLFTIYFIVKCESCDIIQCFTILCFIYLFIISSWKMFRFSMFVFVILKGKMRNLKLLCVCVILFGVLQFYYYFILKKIIVYFFLKGKWETKKIGSPLPSSYPLRTIRFPLPAMHSPSPFSRSPSPLLPSTSLPSRSPSPLCPLNNE